MQRYLQTGFLGLAVFLLGCGSGIETANLKRATLNGMVIDNVMGGGIAGAMISVSSLTATSDDKGAYHINGLVDGLHELIIQADGYELSKEALEVSLADEIHRKTVMVPYD